MIETKVFLRNMLMPTQFAFHSITLLQKAEGVVTISLYPPVWTSWYFMDHEAIRIQYANPTGYNQYIYFSDVLRFRKT